MDSGPTFVLNLCGERRCVVESTTDKMERSSAILLVFSWVLIAVCNAGTDLEAGVDPVVDLGVKSSATLRNDSNLNEKTGGLNSIVESNIVDPVKKGQDQVAGQTEYALSSKASERNPEERKEGGLKEDPIQEKDKNGFVGEGGKKEILGEDSESKYVKKLGEGSVSKDVKEVDKQEKLGEGFESKNSKEGVEADKEEKLGKVLESIEVREGEKQERLGQGSEFKEVMEDDKKEKSGQESESKEVMKGEKKEKSGEGSESKEGSKELPVSFPLGKKEGSHGEECDASNSCKAENNKLVACLRVPGNESPDLSLLIQNKGNSPLSVTISAPDFVQLEETKVQLQEKKDKKVKVSIGKGGTDSLIVLTAGNGNCSLGFQDLIPLDQRKEIDYSSKFNFISLVKRTHLIALIVFAAGLITASAWICISFQRRRYFTGKSAKYQRLDMELPVSSGVKAESVFKDGWDNSWDDNWDDEEAPQTPPLPVTPSVSSKGLSSRRLSKEGWKD
ncbi:uncharacterized protein LOC127813055 isoform X2 [Diospyros lotus]|uniref:uncharacterized protein LOC127813055 isoform X2 n=1 Tax=Diospyros lotus TaxID=55363 RepID=UPI002258825A|nr:uncharacterized protein LOC127813055 isoform X2 [Diospyros lotus]